MPLSAIKVHFSCGGNISVKSKPKEFVMNKFSRFVAACAAVLCVFGAEAALLPDGYQAVEYVDSTGTQWFDTGIVVNENHEFRFKYAMLSINAYKGPFGSYVNEGSNATRVMADNGSTTALLVNFMTMAGGGGTTFNNVTTRAGDVVEGWMNYNRAKFNAVEQDLNHAAIGAADTSTLKLLGRQGYATSIRLYYFQVFEGNELKHSYIPCYEVANPTNIRIYDTCMGALLPMSGSGELKKGEDVFLGNDLRITGTPDELGSVEPAYGAKRDIAPGDSFVCSASAAWTNAEETVAATCVGYKVYTNEVVYVEGSNNSFTYEHPDCETGAKLVWQWQTSYKATATAGEHGSVTSTSAWLKDGESTEVTATATPDDGYVFTRWEGDLGEASPLENPIKVVMTPEKRSLVAVFGQKIVVAADGSGAYTTLEEAVTAANSNDVIVIKAGNYPIRDKNMTFFSINKAVTIVSESGDPKDVHLHGFGPWNDMKYAGGNFQNNGYKLDHKYAILNGVTLRKFTSDNPGDGQDLALRIVNGLAENVVISNCVGNHKVTGVRLYGGEIRNSLICENKGPNEGEASGVDAQGGIVRNCTIRGNSSPGCAVKVQAASAKVVDCQIISNTGGDTNGGGLKLTDGLVENCIISNNTGASAGVYMTGGTLKGCLVTGNTANYARKFGGVNATGGTIEDCTIFANTAYYPDGMQLKMTGGTVKGTTVAAKFDAIPCSDYVSVASGVTVENSTFQCPSVNGSTELNASDVFAEREFHIHADKVVGLAPMTVNFSAAGTAATPSWNFGDETVSSEATPSHTFEKAGRYTVTLTAGGDATTLDIIALPAKTYVGKGSATFPYDTEEKATPDFQAAHDAVYADDTVHGTVEVLADTYTYTGGDVSGSFKPWMLVNKNVTVEGATGNRDNVVFDAKQKIMTTFLFHPKAVLKDLTISNGRYNVSALYGATLHMMEGFITNCIISKGYCNFGGNATIRGGKIVDSVFREGKVNRAGPDRPGGGLDVYGAVTVAGCVFEGNDGDYGGGLYMNNSSCVVSNCVIRNNTCGGAGGGVVLNGGLLTHCVITNNSVNSDGGGLYLITGTARNCLIAGNKANKTSAPSWGYGGSGGGGVAMANGTLENCTVAFNKSESSTRCDELSMQNGTVRNCVFLGKDDDANCDVYKTGGTVTYSSFRKEIAGTGNIKDDVKMKSPSTGDYTLLYGSPAIDGGMEIAAVKTDLNGTPRPVGDAYDMGCYEMDYSGQMVATFDADVTEGSVSVEVTLTANVDGGNAPYTYIWTIGGQTYETADPAFKHIFGYGSHDVTLVVRDSSVPANVSEPVERKSLIKVKTEVAYVSNEGANVWPYDTWEKAAEKIQDAVEALTYSDDKPGVVYVADGTYTKRSGEVNFAVKLAAPIHVVGTNADCKAILDGTSSGLRGVSITHAKARLCNITVQKFNGGGYGSGPAIYQSAGVVSNVVVQDHTVSGSAGIQVTGGLFTDSVIRNGSAGTFAGGDRHGGGAIVSGGVLQNTVISNCVGAVGGGVALTGNDGVVRNCLIDNCRCDGYGGGAAVVRGTLENCVIRNCKQTGTGATAYINNISSTMGRGASGIGVYGTTAVVRNCLVTGCSTEGPYDFGAPVYVGGKAKFYNNTVWTNTTKKAESHSVYTFDADTVVANSIFESVTNTTATVDSCFIAATDGDPMLKNVGNGDFHVRSNSPAKNAGDNSFWEGVSEPVDLDGLPRIRFGQIDVGCYENQVAGFMLYLR